MESRAFRGKRKPDRGGRHPSSDDRPSGKLPRPHKDAGRKAEVPRFWTEIEQKWPRPRLFESAAQQISGWKPVFRDLTRLSYPLNSVPTESLSSILLDGARALARFLQETVSVERHEFAPVESLRLWAVWIDMMCSKQTIELRNDGDDMSGSAIPTILLPHSLLLRMARDCADPDIALLGLRALKSFLFAVRFRG